MFKPEVREGGEGVEKKKNARVLSVKTRNTTLL